MIINNEKIKNMLESDPHKFIESKTHTEKDYQVLKQLEEYFENSVGSNVEKVINFSKYIRSQDLAHFLSKYEIFKKILNIPGAIVECGVLFGGGLMSFAHFSAIFEPLNHSRKIIGFDTFSGFSDLAEEDKHSTSDFAEKGNMSIDSFDDLKKGIEIFDSLRYINHIPRIELVKGDVKETIPKYLKENLHMLVSLLYLDLDVYEPTKIALENFVPRMPKGGIIVFDELNCKAWPGETKALLDTVGIRNFKIEKFSFNNYRSYLILE